MEICRLPKPNFDELGSLLNIESKWLESNFIELPDVKLEVSVVKGKVTEGIDSSVVLEIYNKGERNLRNIRIQILAPSDVRLSSPDICKTHDLLPPEPLRITLKLTPKTAPVCPLEVFIDSDDLSAIPSYPIPVHVDVLPPDSAQATIP